MAGNTTILSAIQTIIQAMSRYASANVTIGDTRILGSGTGPWAILWPGPVRFERSGDWGQVDYLWSDDLEIFRPFDGDDLTNIIADLDDVLSTLATYPTLNGTANISQVVVGRVQPKQLWPTGTPQTGKPARVGFVIPLEITEYRTHDGSGEFA